tara:strand:- start:1067 stop:1213 length:147 start_codon:yes stop_codon:yes gene_type:complete
MIDSQLTIPMQAKDGSYMKILMAALVYLLLAKATYAQTTRAIRPVVLL